MGIGIAKPKLSISGIVKNPPMPLFASPASIVARRSLTITAHPDGFVFTIQTGGGIEIATCQVSRAGAKQLVIDLTHALGGVIKSL
jgi:hypothetical protein